MQFLHFFRAIGCEVVCFTNVFFQIEEFQIAGFKIFQQFPIVWLRQVVT